MRYKICPDRFHMIKIKLQSEMTEMNGYSKSQVETKFFCQEKWIQTRSPIKVLKDISEIKICQMSMPVP